MPPPPSTVISDAQELALRDVLETYRTRCVKELAERWQEAIAASGGEPPEGIRHLTQMLAHPLRKSVAFDDQRQCFIWTDAATGKTTALKGLTKLLDERFGGVNGNTGGDTMYVTGDASRQTATAGADTQFRTRLLCTKTGRAHGSRVHDELEEFVNACRKNKPLAVKGFDLCTLRFLQKIRQLGLAPVLAEYPLADTKHRVGTAIDVVCADFGRPGWPLVLVELKCGCGTQKSYTVSSARKTKVFPRSCPLGGQPVTMHAEHQLQVSSMLDIVRRLYGIPIRRGILLRAPRASSVVWVYEELFDEAAGRRIYAHAVAERSTLGVNGGKKKQPPQKRRAGPP